MAHGPTMAIAAVRVERRLLVLDELLTPTCGGVERVEVEPRLEELAGRRRVDRELRRAGRDDLLRSREHVAVRAQRRSSRADAGFRECLLVVEDHDRV